MKEFEEDGVTVVRELAWNELTNSGSWRIPDEDALANGIVAKTRDEYDRLKVAPPLGAFAGDEAEARKARADFVNEHGIEKYFSRNSAA